MPAWKKDLDQGTNAPGWVIMSPSAWPAVGFARTLKPILHYPNLMADPKAKILPVFRPRVDAALGTKRISSPVFATTRGQSKPTSTSEFRDLQLADNVLTAEEDEDAAPDLPMRKPQKRRVLIFDEADVDPGEVTAIPTTTPAREEAHAKRTTVLRVKRKREESTLDAIGPLHLIIQSLFVAALVITVDAAAGLTTPSSFLWSCF
jgi:hypothetical protein